MSHPGFICEHGAIRRGKGRMDKTHPHHLRSYNARHAKLPFRASCIFCLGRAESLPWDVRWRSRFRTVTQSTKILVQPLGNRLSCCIVQCIAFRPPQPIHWERVLPYRKSPNRVTIIAFATSLTLTTLVFMLMIIVDMRRAFENNRSCAGCGVRCTSRSACSCMTSEEPLACAVH